MNKNKYLLLSVSVILLLLAGCGNDGDEPTPSSGDEPNPEVSKFAMPKANEAVDLGLSVLWSTCNFGAKNVGQHGGYFAWGDPTGELYSAAGIERSPNGGYSKWVTTNYGGVNPPHDISGTNLDVVTRHWGNGWRMPTRQEIEELRAKCEWTLVENYSVKRYQVTGPNGNSIVIPLSGMLGEGKSSESRFSYPMHVNETGFYWTSNTSATKFDGRGYYVADDIVTACVFIIIGPSEKGYSDHLRAFHMSIRPVHDK